MPFLFIFGRLIRWLVSAFRDRGFRDLLGLVVLILLAGTLFYHRWEGWSLLDSLYFSVITLTTIGYGDLSPQTPGGKIFTMIYIFSGLGLFAGFIAYIGEKNMANVRQRHRDEGEQQ